MDINFVVGGLWQDKDRKTDISDTDQDGELDNRDWDQFSDSPVDLLGAFGELEPADLSQIEGAITRTDAP